MQYCTVAFTSHTRARSTLQSLQSRGLDRRPTAFKTMRYTNRQPLPFFTFSEVTADWHELMIQEPVLRLPIAHAIRQLDWRRSIQTYHKRMFTLVLLFCWCCSTELWSVSAYLCWCCCHLGVNRKSTSVLHCTLLRLLIILLQYSVANLLYHTIVTLFLCLST